MSPWKPHRDRSISRANQRARVGQSRTGRGPCIGVRRQANRIPDGDLAESRKRLERPSLRAGETCIAAEDSGFPVRDYSRRRNHPGGFAALESLVGRSQYVSPSRALGVSYPFDANRKGTRKPLGGESPPKPTFARGKSCPKAHRRSSASEPPTTTGFLRRGGRANGASRSRSPTRITRLVIDNPGTTRSGPGFGGNPPNSDGSTYRTLGESRIRNGLASAGNSMFVNREPAGLGDASKQDVELPRARGVKECRSPFTVSGVKYVDGNLVSVKERDHPNRKVTLRF